MDPFRDGLAPTEAPDLDLKHRECGQVRDFRAVFAAEDVGLLDLDPTRKNTIERVGQQTRAGGHLEETVLASDVLFVLGVELAQILDTIHKLRDAGGNMMVAVEADGTICNSF